LDIKLNVSSILNTEISNQEQFIELFNAKLLKIIIHLEEQGGSN